MNNAQSKAEQKQLKRPIFIEELKWVFRKINVPWETWGKGNGSRTLRKLENVLNEEQVTLCIENGIATLHVKVCVILVYYRHTNPHLILREKFQRHLPNGPDIVRAAFDGIAETKKLNETLLHQTAERGLREELGFTDPQLYTLSQEPVSQTMGPMDSRKWPGLRAYFYREKLTCDISEKLFKSEGYVEKKPHERMEIHFGWKEVT